MFGFDVCLRQGQLLLNGRPLPSNDEHYQRQCGMLQQLSLPFFDELTVEENLFYCAMMRMDKDKTVEEKLKRVQQILVDVSLVNFVSKKKSVTHSLL